MSQILHEFLRPQPTGGTIVTFHKDSDVATQRQALVRSAGEGVRSLSGGPGRSAEMSDDAPAFHLEDVGIGVISEHVDAQRSAGILSGEESVVEARPEFWLFAIQDFQDTADRTWGIAATGAETSQFTGAGIKLAVLDTGLDFEHPDFTGRNLVQQSFVTGQLAQDVQGHGTHCCGTAAGREVSQGVPRYGVAPEVHLHVGKVLNDSGSGRERDIINGMIWAIQQGCAVISMSLGRRVRQGEGPSAAYERVGELALDSGSLIIAAAGNDSPRQFGFIAPVGAPANSKSIMAVAALDENLKIADFSCGEINAGGGEVDIAGPGVNVLSSVPRPQLYDVKSGTSMACPHVAGIAALLAQSDANLRGKALWTALTDSAKALSAPASDVGAGLAQAPQGAPDEGYGKTPVA